MLSVRMTPEEIKHRLRPVFERDGVELVVLFGSQATGRAGPKSDIDIAVRAQPQLAIEDLRLDCIRLLCTDRLDLVDLRRAPPLLMMAIAKTGTPLHESDPSAFARFASLALRRFNDTRKLRAERERGLRQFLEERGLA